MPTKPRLHPIAQFVIHYLQFIDEQHQATQELPEFATQDTLKELYRLMVLVRTLDQKAVNLQRMGKIGTLASSLGQEGFSVGLGHAMHADDIYCPAYRDQGVLLQRGVTLSELFAFWAGDERGNCYANNAGDLPTCVTVAGQCLHAAGVAFAVKYRQQQRAVVTVIGDGGTSKGDFYEALNLAGAWHLPLVVVINNNQWAISTPRKSQSAAQTLAQKAIAAGIDCLQVDGNDVVAVRYAAAEAIAKARANHSPSVIEAMTYRLCDHTTADDAKRYCPEDEIKPAWEIEPIARLAHYMTEQGFWSEQQDKAAHQQCSQEVDDAITQYEATPKAPVSDMFNYLYEQLPDALVDQRQQLEDNQND